MTDNESFGPTEHAQHTPYYPIRQKNEAKNCHSKFYIYFCTGTQAKTKKKIKMAANIMLIGVLLMFIAWLIYFRIEDKKEERRNRTK